MRFLPLLLIAAVARAAPECPTVTFEPWLSFDDHNLAWDLQVVDLNRDGRPDFVVTESNYDFVSVFFNTGAGFDELHQLPTGDQPYPVSVFDVDRDGQLDLCTGGGDRALAVLFARDGGFAAPGLFADAGPAAITGLVVGDFDGDGVADSSAGSNFSNTLTLMHGVGNSFVSWLELDAGAPLGPAARGDLNGDGLADAVHTAYFSGLAVLLSRAGAPPELTRYSSSIPSNLDDVELADLDGDGRLDVVQGAYRGVGGYLQQSDGTFVPTALVIDQPLEIFGVTTGDFDGDGRVDLVAADAQQRVSVFLNEASGFSLGGELTALDAPLRVAAGDFDGDGRVDLVLTEYNTSKVRVFRNVTACALQPDGGPAMTMDGGGGGGGGDGGSGPRWVSVGCSCGELDGLMLAGVALLLRRRKR